MYVSAGFGLSRSRHRSAAFFALVSTVPGVEREDVSLRDPDLLPGRSLLGLVPAKDNGVRDVTCSLMSVSFVSCLLFIFPRFDQTTVTRTIFTIAVAIPAVSPQTVPDLAVPDQICVLH
jgi:hypothetical protein